MLCYDNVMVIELFDMFFIGVDGDEFCLVWYVFYGCVRFVEEEKVCYIGSGV